jgi:hypothetical protein
MTKMPRQGRREFLHNKILGGEACQYLRFFHKKELLLTTEEIRKHLKTHPTLSNMMENTYFTMATMKSQNYSSIFLGRVSTTSHYFAEQKI